MIIKFLLAGQMIDLLRFEDISIQGKRATGAAIYSLEILSEELRRHVIKLSRNKVNPRNSPT
jgi:hypothetical protein